MGISAVKSSSVSGFLIACLEQSEEVSAYRQEHLPVSDVDNDGGKDELFKSGGEGEILSEASLILGREKNEFSGEILGEVPGGTF